MKKWRRPALADNNPWPPTARGSIHFGQLGQGSLCQKQDKNNKEKCRWQKAILLCSACPVYILSEKKITTTENTCGKKKGWLRLSLLEIWDWSNNFPSLPPLLLIWLLICLNLKPDPPKRGLEGQENPWRGQMIKRTGSSTYRKYQSSQLKIEKKLTIQRGKEAQMKEMVLVKQRSIWALDWIMSFKCNSKFHQIISNLGWYLILIHQYFICVSLVMFRLPNVPLKMMKKCFFKPGAPESTLDLPLVIEDLVIEDQHICIIWELGKILL